jgi:predicted phosphodiesterase
MSSRTAAEELRNASMDGAEREAAREKVQRLETPDPYPPIDHPPEQGIDILVIPDSHATPGVPNHRYEWAGRLAADQGIDCVVELGDWHDMASLSQWDQGKKVFEGRRYWEDIDIGLDARLRFARELAGHSPRLIACVGNHEDRISRFIESEPRFEGIIGLEDLRHDELGWESIPFTKPVDVSGVLFNHYHVSGVMSRPVGGIHQASNVISKTLRSSVMGHTHVWDAAVRSDSTGHRLHGLVAGCYFEHYMDWAGPANALYHRCLTILRNCQDGEYDLEVWGMDRIKATYG